MGSRAGREPNNKERTMPITQSVLQMKPHRSPWQRVVGGIALVFEAFQDARRLRAAVRSLQALDDRTLADIGISRSGIEAAVRGDVTRENRAPEPAEVAPPAMRMAA
jgi:uncharacterized protein YjiS (DUF1127 family)